MGGVLSAHQPAPRGAFPKAQRRGGCRRWRPRLGAPGTDPLRPAEKRWAGGRAAGPPTPGGPPLLRVWGVGDGGGTLSRGGTVPTKRGEPQNLPGRKTSSPSRLPFTATLPPPPHTHTLRRWLVLGQTAAGRGGTRTKLLSPGRAATRPRNWEGGRGGHPGRRPHPHRAEAAGDGASPAPASPPSPPRPPRLAPPRSAVPPPLLPWRLLRLPPPGELLPSSPHPKLILSPLPLVAVRLSNPAARP